MGDLIAGRYEVLAEHGGGQGTVLEAVDRRHDRRVAIKVRPRSSEALAEAHALLKIGPHPSLPVAREDFFVGDDYLLVTDWIDGENLDGRVLTLVDALGVLRQLAGALDHLHMNDPPIIHGDVKPANVIFDRRGRAVLVDLGLAGRSRGSGTFGFAAPEVAAGAGATAASDVYGLAATAYAMLSGGPPATTTPATVHPGVLRAIRSGLATRPGDRPPSASSLLDSLLAAATSELPEGAVTFLFTDLEGSTRLWEEHASTMARALADHDAIINTAVAAHGGRLLKSKGEGDSTVSVFDAPAPALDAAQDAQRHLAALGQTYGLDLRVRMAAHMGDAELRDGDYFGPTLNRAARLRGIAHGGQIICSEAVAAAIADDPDGGHAPLLDLGTHRLRDLARPEHIFQVGLETFPPLLSLANRRTNLPSQATSFVGRERELERVFELLALSRLVTLTGPGGSGKTRLAIQSAADLLDRYPDGVWLVELAALTDAALIGPAIASTIGIAVPPLSTALHAVIDALQERTALIVLDNCEHLIDGAAETAQALLDGCGDVRLLATSRERLRLPSEAIWPVPGLELPEAQDDPSQAEAGQLFLARARAVRPGLVVDDATNAAMTAICRRLDGIPLAIELAAARVANLPVPEIARRLDDRFAVLAGGSRAVLPRQRSLRAMIDWSYDLLSADEQTVLRRLAVFRGGWTLASAEQLADIGDVLDPLSSLVDKNLVILDETLGRYRMLETIREYGLDRLRDAGEHDEWQRRLAEHASAFATGAWERRSGFNGALMRELAAEKDNLTAALSWACSHDFELAGRIYSRTGGLVGMLTTDETHFWSLRVAEHAAEMSPATRSLALTWAGQGTGYGGQVERSVEWLSRAVEAGRQSGDRCALGYALLFSERMERLLERPATADAFMDEALQIAQALDDALLLGLVLVFHSGRMAEIGDHVAAGAALARAEEVAAAAGNSYVMQFVLGSKVNNGPDYPRDRTWGADELDRRAAGLNRMAEIQADFNDLFSAMTRLDLAVVPLDRGDLDRGIDMLNELIASKKLSHFQYELYAHDLLAWAYHFKGRDDEAVALLDPWLSGTRPTRDSDMNWISLGAAIFRRDLDALIDASRWMADNPPTNISGWTEDSRRFRIGLACAALARFTIEHGRAEEAARLLGAWLLPDDGNYLRFEVRPIREMVEPRLEPDVFARELAWATGRPADELIAFALETAFGTRST